MSTSRQHASVRPERALAAIDPGRVRDRERLAWWLALAALGALALAVRLVDMNSYGNIDGVALWSKRIPRFWQALEAGDWPETFQHIHPGVTLMWLVGALWKWRGHLDAFTPEALWWGKLPAAVISSLACVWGAALLRRLGGRSFAPVAWLSALLLATEPYLLSHSRSMHLDAMLTAFCWVGALYGLLAVREGKLRYWVGSGVLLALAMLTKISAAGVVAGTGLALLVLGLWLRTPPLGWLRGAIAWGIALGVVIVALWPALWVDPLALLERLQDDTSELAARGHAAFYWGRTTMKPGHGFYPTILLFRLSHETLWLVLPGLVILAWAGPVQRRLLLGLLLAYLPLAVALTLSAKKHDRYVLPFYPLLCVLAAASLATAFRWLARLVARLSQRRSALLWTGAALALLVGVRLVRVAQVHPLPGVWCASYPGLACEEAFTLGFGEGLKETALWLEHHDPTNGQGRIWVYSPMYAHCMRPWLRNLRITGQAHKAHFLLGYVGERQRGLDRGRVKRYARGRPPVFTLDLDGVRYVELYPGPRHPDVRKSRRASDAHSTKDSEKR